MHEELPSHSPRPACESGTPIGARSIPGYSNKLRILGSINALLGRNRTRPARSVPVIGSDTLKSPDLLRHDPGRPGTTGDILMKPPASHSFDPTDPRFYGEDYYARHLHDRHWFRNNPAKFQMRWNRTIACLQPLSDDLVLELGCAAGEHTFQLAPMVRRIIGLDFSPDAIRLARAENERRGGKAEFVQGDAADLGQFADASIDKVLALDLVEHVTDDVLARMFSETWRVLRPGGRLVIYTPSASHYVERMKAANFILRQLPGHIAVRRGEAYQSLLDAEPWASVKLEYLPSSYPVFGWMDRCMARLPRVGAMFRFRILITAIKP